MSSPPAAIARARFSKAFWIFAAGFFIFASLTGHAPHAFAALGPNLVPNPSLESGSGSLPTSWKQGGYGANTRVFTYPDSPGHTGTRAAKVEITSYTSGDAKWYFNGIAVTPGATYQFSDWYKANVPSEVDVEVSHANGTRSYIVLGHPVATSGYAQFSGSFTAPPDAASVTIFHVIKRVGTLTIDDYALNRVTASGDNLVANGDFETTAASGLPAGWHQGGWGSNSRSFAYPVTGASGKGARVSIGSYASGDAKWYSDPVMVSSGIYRYTDSYQANVPSMVTVEFHHTDGSFTYLDIATVPSSSSFRGTSADIVIGSDVREIVVFHLIKQVGTLTVDNVSLTRLSSSGIFTTGAVTFSFDDGWLSQYQNALPKLTQSGLKGTFYIVSRQLADFGFPGYMSQAQVKEVRGAGMEIGGHTRTHRDLTQLSSSEQQAEISGSRQDLIALGVGPVNSFAYPFGAYNSSVITIVKNAGYTNARTTNGGYVTPSSPLYELPRFRVLNSTTVAEMKSWVDEAAESHSWLIFVFHRVDTSGDTESITPANFNAVVDYVKQKGIPVVTVEQGMHSLSP